MTANTTITPSHLVTYEKDKQYNLAEQAALNFGLDLQEHNLFWDWFCPDSQLKRRGTGLANKVQEIMEANAASGFKHFNPLTTYAFFKNNCPLYGSTYDDFRICNLTDGQVLFTVVPPSPRAKREAELWVREDGVDRMAEAQVSCWSDIVAYFAS